MAVVVLNRAPSACFRVSLRKFRPDLGWHVLCPLSHGAMPALRWLRLFDPLGTPHSFPRLMVMYVLRPVASCSGSLDININKRGWRLPLWCGLAAALCLGWPVPAKMQAQTTASFSGTTTVLGSGFSGPTGVAVDGSGNVFVADTENNAVKEIVAVSGSIPASNPTINVLGSGFNAPAGVAVDGNGNVFVADTSNNLMKEIVAVNGSIPA